jgi:hypothetical protein
MASINGELSTKPYREIDGYIIKSDSKKKIGILNECFLFISFLVSGHINKPQK